MTDPPSFQPPSTKRGEGGATNRFLDPENVLLCENHPSLQDYEPPRNVKSAKYSSSSDILFSDTSDPIFDRFTSLAKRLFNVPAALVTIIDDDCFWIKSKSGVADMTKISKGKAFCTHLFDDDYHNVFIVEDASKDERFKDNILVHGKPHIRFYAGK